LCAWRHGLEVLQRYRSEAKVCLLSTVCLREKKRPCQKGASRQGKDEVEEGFFFKRRLSLIAPSFKEA